MRFLIFGILVLVSTRASGGDSCSVKFKNEGGKYVGCITTVNKYTTSHGDKELTRLGCETFCEALSKPSVKLQSIQYQYDEGAGFDPNYDNCKADKIVSESGNYEGCKINLNSHVYVSDIKELTPLGCETFCPSLKRLKIKSMPKNTSKSRPDATR